MLLFRCYFFDLFDTPQLLPVTFNLERWIEKVLSVESNLYDAKERVDIGFVICEEMTLSRQFEA